MREGYHTGGRRRKRISRACDHCRKKKDRCDGFRPTCSPCRNSGSVCSYDPIAKKRGLPEGYVRGLEKLWALSILNIKGLEEKVLALLGIDGQCSSVNQRFHALWVDENVSDKLHGSWKSSDLYGELEKLLSTAETSGSILAHSAAKSDDGKYYGFAITHRMSPSTSATRRTDCGHKLAAPWGYDSTLGSQSSPESGGVELDLTKSPYQEDICQLRLPPNSSQLLDIYFSHTHPWFPVIARHTILHTSGLYHNQEIGISRTSAGSGNHAALLAALSYATFQQNSILPGCQSLEITGIIGAAKALHSTARNLIPAEVEAIEIGHVQALLLLALVNIGLGDWTAAWPLIGEAVRSTTYLVSERHPIQDHGQSGHQGSSVLLGCFLIDTLMSVRLGNCPHMRVEDLSEITTLGEDTLDAWGPWTGIFSIYDHNISPEPIRPQSCFNSMVELAGFMNRICRIEVLDSAAPSLCWNLLKDLENWENTHPLLCPSNGMNDNLSALPNAPILLPHQTYLSLTYTATLTLLYLRCFSHIPSLYHPLRMALLRVGPIIASHEKHFPQSPIPPLFEVILRTIANGIPFSGLTTVHGENSPDPSHVLESILQASNSTASPMLCILSQEMGQPQLPIEIPRSPDLHSNHIPNVPRLSYTNQSTGAVEGPWLDAAFTSYQTSR